jgi:hypothetical protein
MGTRYVTKLASKLAGDAVLWMCYPKKSSKNYHCDFNRDSGWEILGDYELEGVRIVAIDADWSALRFRKVAYIKKIRKDGKLDLSLQPIGKKNSADIYEVKVLEIIEELKGFVALNSKSDALNIMKVFGLSKKSFKRTLTSLLEKKKIVLESNGIKLL